MENLAPRLRKAQLSLRIAKTQARLNALKKFDPDQPRDKGGRWSRVGGAVWRGVKTGARIGAKLVGPALVGFAAYQALRDVPAIARSVRGMRDYRRGLYEGVEEFDPAASRRTLEHLESWQARERERKERERKAREAPDNAELVARERANLERIWEASRARERERASRQEAMDAEAGRRAAPKLTADYGPGMMERVFEPPKASVAFMVTRDMKQQLMDRGFTRAQVAAMTPDEAHRHLSKLLKRLLKRWEEGKHPRDKEGQFSGGGQGGGKTTEFSGRPADLKRLFHHFANQAEKEGKTELAGKFRLMSADLDRQMRGRKLSAKQEWDVVENRIKQQRIINARKRLRKYLRKQAANIEGNLHLDSYLGGRKRKSRKASRARGKYRRL